jgi:hypothetical protein
VRDAYIAGNPSPAVQALSNIRFMHTRGTVRCVCVQKGGGAMCTLQGARRTGAFERSEAGQVRPAGARSPSTAGTPFAVAGAHLALF